MKHAPIILEDVAEAHPDQTLSSVRVPHLTVAAFCLTATTDGAITRASQDRRLTRVKTQINTGSVDEARRMFETKQTPSLLIVEIDTSGETLLEQLDSLAEVCDPATKVVIVGVENDIRLYRTLMERGISEYLVGAITPLTYVAIIQRLFGQESDSKLGKMYAFVGAKGGVGASTLAQNVAWTIAEEQSTPTLLLDLDFRFGSAAINLDLKPMTGLEKYVTDPEKLDAALLDRLIVHRGEYLSVLPGFDDVLCDIEPAPGAIERLIEIARASFPHVVVDLPHDWSPASRDTLTSADHVILVSAPDLSSLRNSLALTERLRALRPNDAPPMVILNACQMPKRKEIAAGKFASSLGLETYSAIAFDPATFGAASVKGQTIREQSPRSKAQKSIRRIVHNLAGKTNKRPRSWLGRHLGLG
jgi:pilus assembly protein CpaE